MILDYENAHAEADAFEPEEWECPATWNEWEDYAADHPEEAQAFESDLIHYVYDNDADLCDALLRGGDRTLLQRDLLDSLERHWGQMPHNRTGH